MDEHFAPAWRELAILHAQAHWFGLDRSPRRIDQARRDLDQARLLASPADQMALAEGIFAWPSVDPHLIGSRCINCGKARHTDRQGLRDTGDPCGSACKDHRRSFN